MNSFVLLFANRTIVELLKTFFYAPEKEFYQAYLVECTSLRLVQVQRGLKLLVECDLLKTRKEGNRIYYHLNDRHPALENLMKIFMKMFMLVPFLKSSLSSLKKNILYCFIYGSMAKSSQKEASDIDLFIVGDVELRTLSKYLLPLSHELGKEINPHVCSEQEFYSKLLEHNSFINDVVSGSILWVLGDEKKFREMVERRKTSS